MTRQSLVAVGQKITASLANWLIGQGNAQGQSLVLPSGISGTGASMTAGGVVNLSACTSVTINGVFTSAYTNYLILIDVTLASSGTVFLQAASGGTVDTSSNYDLQWVSGVGTTASAAQTLAAASWGVGAVNGTTHLVSVELFGPDTSSGPCLGLVKAFGTPDPMTTAAGVRLMGIQRRTTSAFDGLCVNAASGISGQVSIFGYNPGV